MFLFVWGGCHWRDKVYYFLIYIYIPSAASTIKKKGFMLQPSFFGL